MCLQFSKMTAVVAVTAHSNVTGGPSHLENPYYNIRITSWCREDWKQEEKGATEDEMASPTQWTWVWASSRRQWWTEKPGVLQSMGSQGVRHSWATEQLRKVPTAMGQLPGWGNWPASSSPLKSHLARASVRTEQTKGRESCFVNNCHNNLHLMRAYSVQAMWLFREALTLKPPPLCPHHQIITKSINSMA